MNKAALVMGGNGTLGKAIVNTLKKNSWRVLSVDYAANDKADANHTLNKTTKI